LPLIPVFEGATISGIDFGLVSAVNQSEVYGKRYARAEFFFVQVEFQG
jgi:hypothetical protein